MIKDLNNKNKRFLLKSTVLGKMVYICSRENPNRAERRFLNETCLPVFKYFKPKKKSKVLIHGFGDDAEDSLMFPILRDGQSTVHIY